MKTLRSIHDLHMVCSAVIVIMYSCGQVVCILECCEPQRGIQYVCCEWHIIQSREPQTWPHIRYQEGLMHADRHYNQITRAVAAIMAGKQSKLVLGNIDSLRDWGHANDYIKVSMLCIC